MRTRRTSSALSARTTNEWWLVITTLFWHRHLRITRRAHSCDVARVTKFSSRPRYKIHCVIWDKLLSLTHLQSSYNRSNLAIFTTLSLFNLLDLAVPSLFICCHSYSRPPTVSLKTTDRWLHIIASPRLWNQLPDSSVSLTSLVSNHLLIHLSIHLSHHPRSHHPPPPLLHFFTPGRLKTYLFNKSFPS